ncbi:Enoyl-CoA hydratase/carnithine racemase [Haloechinothrix alba]|uniref:Enoyl-CoA hydratase/carnithine racemase n=1 Tax=Haloechinothrix alba TaxID=664784 RepID=A0A238WZE2_9PSEU|nr:enoyl-CoA hydratase-related protein [Haloechinothrix alba]SNR51812.1 Enoyl-CoA hydratase/carnithine racemase [Haloechinothrix alba]
MIEGFELVREGDLAWLTFTRPDKHNAITLEMWSEIPRVVREVEDDPAVKVLMVTGSGANFSAGADIGEFRELRSSAEGAARYDEAVQEAVRSLSEMVKPSVAVVRGNCIGGGCQISVACDFRFAAANARFGITPAKLGIVYDYLSTRQLVGLVGPAQARYFLLSGQLVDAPRAREIGLVNDTSTDDELDGDARAFAATLGSRSQFAVRGMNRIITKITDGQPEADDEVDRIRSEAITGPDYAEGVSAFLERRTPQFPHR